jgi:hypothetical protein
MNRIRCFQLAIALYCAFDSGVFGGEPSFDPKQLPLFTAGKVYLDQYETGLYPGAKNDMPAAHREAVHVEC